MTVYLVVQVKFKDRERYDRYSDRFMDVFRKFDGELLAADFDPKVISGEWDKDRLVLMKFPDEDAMKAWMTSDEYQEIAVDREAGADLTAFLAKGIEAAL